MNSEILSGFQVKVSGRNRWMLRCLCFCGNEFECREDHFKSGETASCGCFQKQRTVENSTTHGGSYSREYTIRQGMIYRCYNPACKEFPYYGGKNPPVRVCERWLESFENFLADMGSCPPGLTLERKITSGDYEPGNCKWDTYTAQQNNRSNNRRVTLDGKTQTLAQWEKQLGLPRGRVAARLNRDRWSVERALTTPVS